VAYIIYAVVLFIYPEVLAFWPVGLLYKLLAPSYLNHVLENLTQKSVRKINLLRNYLM